MSLFRPALTTDQHEYLAAHYATAPKAEVLAMFPGRCWANVMKLGSRIGGTTPTARRPYAPKLWTAPADAYLRAHYPTAGARAVSEHLGVTDAQAGARARYLGVPRIKPVKPVKVAKAPAARNPAPARAPRKLAPKPALLLTPVKLRPSLGNLNASKEARKKAEHAAIANVGITAEAIRKMGYREPARMAYMLGGVAGWQQWKSQQAA